MDFSWFKFPQSFDGQFFATELGRGWIKPIHVNADGSRGAIDTSFPWTGKQVMGSAFGPDGALYVLDYGTGYFNDDAIGVGNTAPTVTITGPANGSLFSYGDTVPFSIRSPSSWIHVWVTGRALVSPVSGSVARTLSPTRTSLMGFDDPSAMRTRVSPPKLQSALPESQSASPIVPAALSSPIGTNLAAVGPWSRGDRRTPAVSARHHACPPRELPAGVHRTVTIPGS